MVSAGNKSQRRSWDSIYRLPNDRVVTTTSRSILASRFSATEEVLMTHSINDLTHHLLLEQGPVWDVLASVIQRKSVDLLVLGQSLAS
jgi:homoserine kinase